MMIVLDEPQEPLRHRRRLTAPLAALLLIGGFGSALWWFYGVQGPAPDANLIPVIAANLGETRIRPEQPGGMEVPYRDRLIFEQAHAPEALEEILSARVFRPPPEEPVARPEGEARASFADPPTQEVEILLARAPAPVREPGAPVPRDRIQPVENERAAQESLPPVVAAAPQPTMLEPPEPSPVARLAAGTHRVELGLADSPSAAERLWLALLQDHSAFLEGLTPTTERSDTDRGPAYRVQAGPLDEIGALSLCATLEERGADCHVRAIH